MKQGKINICDLLIKVGFANSKGEAKRNIAGNGVRLDGEVISDINKIVNIENGVVVQFGKNKFKK